MNNKVHIAFLISIASLLFSCGSGDNQDFGATPPPETDFVLVTGSNADDRTSYPGTIEGSVNVDIKAQVSGYLEAIYVREGDYVKKGQRLFKIKGDVYNEQVKNTEAVLSSALASQANAKLEVEKIRPLVEGKVVADVQLQTAEANYRAASAQVAQARAALGSSKINAAFAMISAPVSGYIGRIPNRIGNLVTPTDAVPLTTLSEIKTVFVYFSMSEADFIAFRKSNIHSQRKLAPVELVMADGSLYPHQGTLETASGNIDRSTGSIAMKAVLPNPDGLLRAGGSGKVIIHRTLENVLKIPKTSVKDLQDKFFVFKLADSNKVRMVAVEIDGNTETDYFLKSGLRPGDKIAINRIDALGDGMIVSPRILTEGTNR